MKKRNLLIKGLSTILLTSMISCSTDEELDLSGTSSDDRRGGPLIEEVTENEAVVTILVEAESYIDMFGIKTQESSEGTDNVGWVQDGDWISFADINLSGISSVNARVASSTNGGVIEIRLGSETGTLIGALSVDNTNGWQEWETVSTAIDATEGINDIYFVFTGDSGYLFNVNWVEFDVSEVAEEETEEVVVVEVSNCDSAFSINLDASECSIDIQDSLGDSVYQETNDGTTRTIIVNNIPNHLVGEFPNPGNPNTIAEISSSYEMTMNPTLADRSTGTGGYVSGVLFSGVGLEVQTAESFVGTDGETNRDWSIVALQDTRDLGLDCNNAHVQPTGQYHYHGAPSAYVNQLGIDGSEMVKIGYAGDGFPIYYKYGYADNGTSIVAFESGYALIEGDRGGDGESAPDGCYDGTYSQDYEYVDGLSQLDECNGRTGRTPESDSEYYYLFTENWPSAPICFSGTPNSTFSFGGGGGQ